MINKSLFEQTMHACQQMKMESAKSKTTAKSRRLIKESKKASIAKRKFEAEDIVDPEDDKVIADDVAGDIVAVIDPEMNADDYEDRLDDLNDIIDSTEEDEEPVDDEYVGDDIYQCPVCGNPFFSEENLAEGGICPVCGDDVEAFVKLGTVTDEEESEEEEEEAEDEIKDTVDTEIEDDLELNDVEEEYNPPKTPKKRPTNCCERYYKYSINEKTLNPFLTKMIKENYKNAVSMKLVKPSINGSTLKLECAIKFKSGKTRRTVITVEGFKPAKKFVMNGKLDSVFKAESKSKKPHVTMRCSIIGSTIKVESFKYNYNVKVENKRCNVYGSYVFESTKRK